jgi:hypothetical protein
LDMCTALHTHVLTWVNLQRSGRLCFVSLCQCAQCFHRRERFLKSSFHHSDSLLLAASWAISSHLIPKILILSQPMPIFCKISL